MSFTIYPAIDIRRGKCVRLLQGDYSHETVYSQDPIEVARKWVAQGARWLHVVDLDAARSGEMMNLSIIEQLVQSVSVPVQVGGGVRDHSRLEHLFSIGVSRVVLGSAVMDDPSFVKAALNQYQDRIAIGIDAKQGWVATHGWLDVAKVTAAELAREMAKAGAETFIFTDISRDGMLTGANVEAVVELAQACGKKVIASGGIRSIDDVQQLAKEQKHGIVGAIVGKALYTEAVRLQDMQAVQQKESQS